MNIFNRRQIDETLSPAGKLYGESFGLPDSFHLAVDKNGRFYKTTHLWNGETPYAKWAGWEEVSAKQLANYLQHFSFVNKNSKAVQEWRETLKPIGKMKGEINDRFEAFYLAVDKNGNMFRNHDMDYSGNPYHKSDRWKETSKQEFENYKKHLHLIVPRHFSVRR